MAAIAITMGKRFERFSQQDQGENFKLFGNRYADGFGNGKQQAESFIEQQRKDQFYGHQMLVW